MHKHPQITEKRIGMTAERIRELIYGPVAPLEIKAHHVGGEPISYDEAMAKEYAPFAAGASWGGAWDTTWFHFSGSIPVGWGGKEVVALIRLGAQGAEGFTNEGLVWRDGVPAGAINVNRAEVTLAREARGGESFAFHVEAAANPCAQGRGYGFPAGGEGQPLFRLERAEIACVNREAREFHYDFQLATDLLAELPEGTPRRGQLLYALNESTNLFDAADPATIPAARAALGEVLGKHNGDTAHQISAVGHAHIDTAWLWPLRETIRKCARTFSTALAYMEEYPGYVFACSQPQQYAWMKEYYPTIFEGIKKAVQRGQWEPVGSMWIEADCNLSSGESLIRQILHGKNFFLEEFGVETTDVWIPDVFGYSASMPQIMQKAGVKYFVTQKISWSQFNKFPHHTFLWEGIDGTRIFTHFPPADTYNGNFSPKELLFGASNFKEHDRATRSLYLYGFGDGGGGPTKKMLEIAARTKDLEGLPRVTLEKASEFLANAEADARDLPVWIGELYLELHRGTYTTQARNKRGNRKCELLLREAEMFSVLAPEAGAREVNPPRAVYDVTRKNEHGVAAYLDRAWKLLLLNQFHDIIPGSSISWVYEDSARDYATIAELGNAVLEPARAQLTSSIDTSKAKRPFVIFNTTSFERNEVVSLPDGTPFYAEIPRCGYAVIDADEERPVASFAAPVEVIERKRVVALDNGMIRVVFDRQGLILSIRDHRTSREVLAPDRRGNLFQLHHDIPCNWDAWDVDIFYRETVQDILDLESMEVVEKTPLRAAIRIIRKFGKSTLTQRISLCAASPRIDFETEVDWQEDNKFLKVAFPVNVHSPRATYEIQYGQTERPTHYNTSWDLARFEVCAQKWADLSEAGYGVALLNDCKYGYDILGNVMRLSLLRAPTGPDPLADRGHHQFTYSLLPHVGDLRQGQVLTHAHALNSPLHVVAAAAHPGSLPEKQSFFQTDRLGVVIEAVKWAEKERAIIVRFYEAYGGRGPVTLTTTLPVKAAFTADLMERTLGPLALAEDNVTVNVKPFEIVTLKFLLTV